LREQNLSHRSQLFRGAWFLFTGCCDTGRQVGFDHLEEDFAARLIGFTVDGFNLRALLVEKTPELDETATGFRWFQPKGHSDLLIKQANIVCRVIVKRSPVHDRIENITFAVCTMKLRTLANSST